MLARAEARNLMPYRCLRMFYPLLLLPGKTLYRMCTSLGQLPSTMTR